MGKYFYQTWKIFTHWNCTSSIIYQQGYQLRQKSEYVSHYKHFSVEKASAVYKT